MAKEEKPKPTVTKTEIKDFGQDISYVSTISKKVSELENSPIFRDKKPDDLVDVEVLHRDDGPAYEFKYETGQKKYEAYFTYGKRSNILKPCTVEYHKNGQKKDEQWYVDNVLHREDGPAWSEWDETGQLRVERWFVNGLYHRLDGPAYITYDELGNVQQQINYRNGEVV